MKKLSKQKPAKQIFSEERVRQLREVAIKEVKKLLLPDDKILKVILIGSSIKNNFGRYKPPGVRGSLYSDFDFIIFVEDDYIIPTRLIKVPDAKPFSNDKLNLTYRLKKAIDETYDIELLFVRKTGMMSEEVQKEGELAGIPMTATSKHKYRVIFERGL